MALVYWYTATVYECSVSAERKLIETRKMKEKKSLLQEYYCTKNADIILFKMFVHFLVCFSGSFIL